MAAKQPEREPLAEPLLAAIRRHRLAKEAYDVARAEHEAARAALVTLLHEADVQGFSL